MKKPLPHSHFALAGALSFLLAFTSLAPLRAQQPSWEWAVSAGAAGYDYCYSIATAPDGSSYATGYFQGTVDFDPGPGTHWLSAQGGNGIYLLKLNDNGEFLWAKGIGGPGYKAGSALALDAYGNIYMVGLFSGTIDADPGMGTTVLTSTGTQNSFITKFSADGDLVWAKALQGPESNNAADIVIGNSGTGNIYISGNFSGTVDFDPGPEAFTLTTVGNNDTYVMKIDTAGTLIWSKSFGGLDGVYCRGMAIDPTGEGSIYCTGYFEGTADMDPDTTTTLPLTSAGNYDMFITKLTSAGNLVWAKRIGGAGFDKSMAITADIHGSHGVYITGAFQGTVDFEPGSEVATLTSVGDFDIFTAKFNDGGGLLWARRSGGPSYEYGMDILVDPTANGDVITVGYFNATADLNPDPASQYNLTSAGNNDLFVQRLSSSGDFKYALGAGGFAPDVALATTIDGEGNILVAGSFFSPEITFGATTLTNAIDFATTGDIFIAKLSHSSTGLSEVPRTAHFAIGPNPASNRLNIYTDLHLKDASIEVTDPLGRSVLQMPFQSSLDLARLAKGVYVLKVSDRGRRAYTQSFVVE